MNLIDIVTHLVENAHRLTDETNRVCVHYSDPEPQADQQAAGKDGQSAEKRSGVFTTSDLADLTGYSATTIAELARHGIIPILERGGCARGKRATQSLYPQEALDVLLSRRGRTRRGRRLTAATA